MRATSTSPAVGMWIRPEKRLAIYLRDSFTCQACGRDLRDADPSEIGLDHLVPRSKGGSNEATNLVTIDRSCNSSRGDRRWTRFYPGGAIERIKSLRYRKLNIPLAKSIIAGESNIIEALR